MPQHAKCRLIGNHFGRLKNQIGEELDTQITHIIVEINKFNKQEQYVQSDLDKLIYIMKNLENLKGIEQLPKFLTEDWIEQAMNKLDKSQMTPDQRMHYEMTLAKNATIIEMLKEEERQQIIEQTAKQTAKQTARRLKLKGMSNEDIQEITDLTIEEIEHL